MTNPSLVIIGSSAGGPRALQAIFSDLPSLNAIIVLIQHMPKFVNQSLTNHLDAVTEMSVRLSEEGDILSRGTVYVAPSEKHLIFERNRVIHLTDDDKVNYVRPSVDITMMSVHKLSERRIIGIILTGMGKDGAAGLIHLKHLGGITMAQNEETSAVFGMPKEAIRTGCVDFVMTPNQMRDKLIALVGLIDLQTTNSASGSRS